MERRTECGINQQFLFLRVEKQYVQVRIAEILYCMARRGGHSLVVTPQKTWLINNPISELERYLPKLQFTRVHNSYLVAISRIQMFDRHKVILFEPEPHFKQGYAQTRELPVGSKRIFTMRHNMLLLMAKRGGSHHAREKELMELKLEEMEWE